jgi:hypothetical protein
LQVVAACPCVSTARPTQSLYNLAEFDDVGYVAGFQVLGELLLDILHLPEILSLVVGGRNKEVRQHLFY